jgi:predicted nucleotidyltransferase
MGNVGIIAEYNPFHNGHKYLIDEARRRTGAHGVIVAQSGDFVQRGEPALIDKYARANMALCCGADMVFEIPAIWSGSSAEDYAMAGVKMLEATGSVDTICFGAECDDEELLSQIAQILVDEPEEFRRVLSLELGNGRNFPTARASAVKITLVKSNEVYCSSKYIDSVLNNPNNILAIEYLKAIKRIGSSMKPCIIKRKGAGYHDGNIDRNREISASASGIRELVSKTGQENIREIWDELSGAIPPEALLIFREYAGRYRFVNADDFSSILNYLLLSNARTDYYKIADITPELAGRMEKYRSDFVSFTDFCSKLKSKNVTYSRVSRAMTHMLLGIKSEDVKLYRERGYILYLRIIGLRRGFITSQVRKNAMVPIITKLADAGSILSDEAMWMLGKDVFASELYATVSSRHSRNEYRNSPVII